MLVGMAEEVHINITFCVLVATARPWTMRHNVLASKFAPRGCGGQ